MGTFRDFSFRVLVNKSPIREFHHQGQIWVEGRKGSEYSLEFRNNSPHKLLAVVSVDGLSVMDGSPADFETGAGYVVAAHDTLIIPGWRLDNQDVAKFKFSGKGKSYAKKSGHPQNQGVIGCAVFREKKYNSGFYSRTIIKPLGRRPCEPWPGRDVVGPTWTGEDTHHQPGTACNFVSVGDPHYDPQSTLTVTDCVAHSGDALTFTNGDVTPKHNLGTEFGKRHGHVVTETSFEREDNPLAVVEFRYTDRTGLEKAGVLCKKSKAYVARAFPNSRSVGCAPPKGWKGHHAY